MIDRLLKLFKAYYYTFFLVFLCIGCNKLAYVDGDSSLKIYLKDAAGNSVKGVKVYLQGDGEQLEANYNSKRRFYFFNQVPNNFHTVLAEHSDYNPKGYQNKEGLPKEVHLELYNPYRVRLPGDDLNYYMEDPYQLVIGTSNIVADDNTLFDDYIQQVSNNMDKIAERNELERIEAEDYSCNLSIFDLTYHVFKKKDGTKFKRFNSKILENFRANTQVVQAGHFLYLTKNNKTEYITEFGKLSKTIWGENNGQQENDYNLEDLIKYSPKQLFVSNYLDIHLDKKPNYISFLSSDGNEGKEMDFLKYKKLLADEPVEEKKVLSNFNRKPIYFLTSEDKSIGLGMIDMWNSQPSFSEKVLNPKLISYSFFCK